MKEDKENKQNNKAASSKIQEKKGQSSDELLEQILSKKKNKKPAKKEEIVKGNKEKTSVKSANKTKKKTTKSTQKNKSKKEKMDLTADELLDNIIAKKEKKTTKKTEKKTSDNENKTKEETKKETKEILDSTSKKHDTSINNSVKQIANIENDEDKTDSENNKIPDKKTQNKQEVLIITRKITFDDEKINLKSKKTLQELRKAIEEFDRLETLNEIATSSDKINDLKKEDIFDKEASTSEKEEKLEEDLFKTSRLVYDSRFNRLYDENNNPSESNTIDKKEIINDETDELEYINDFGNFEPEEVRPQRIKKKKYYDKEERNIIILSIFVILLFAFLILVLFLYLGNKDISYTGKLEPEVKSIISKDDTDDKENRYQECLQEQVPEMEILPFELNDAIANLSAYMNKNYKASVLYKDLTTGFSYSYNAEPVYYAASTIKALDGLYIYTKAANGELNLDDKLEYTSKFQAKSSQGMSQYKYGEKVSLRNLVKYAIVYSDNSAHYMLIDYIEKNNLKEFGESLGASTTLVGSDDFGSINVEDAVIYMEAIYNFIEKDSELGEELKSYLVTAEQNGLEMKNLNIEAAHKYGSYGNYYHDYGIVYDEHPYVIAILTTEGKGDYEEKVRDINRHFYELHKLFYENREKTCKTEIYSN